MEVETKMNLKKTTSTARFVLLILVTAALLTAALCGVYITDDLHMGSIFDEDSVLLGLDLAGGSSITYQAYNEDGSSVTSSGMDSVLEVMRTRLDKNGFTEANVYKYGDDMIVVEIPSVEDPTNTALGFMQTAKLKFVIEGTKDAVLTGEDVEHAKAGMMRSDDSGYNASAPYLVTLEFNDAGAKKFAEATKYCAQNNKKLEIYVDDALISAPTVSSEYKNTGITGGSAIISGSFTTPQSAETLANNIDAGALRYNLRQVSMETVKASLGENALKISLIAGAIGLLLVLIFMCVYYRFPGICASLALLAYTGIFCIVLIVGPFNLTLTGIAGIILSIGMAVDANVVIFERMKEEILAGKAAKTAIKSGYKRALWAVLDSNITTIIACVVLYFFGTGTIQGFALTLGIGVVISLITALLITRAFLNLGVGMGVTNVKCYKVGFAKEGAEKKPAKFHFIKDSKKTLIVVAVVLLIGVLSFVIRGFNIDIDFVGGYEATMDLGVATDGTTASNVKTLIENDKDLGKEFVQTVTADGTSIKISSTTALTMEQQNHLKELLLEAYPDASTELNISNVSPIIGDKMIKSAIWAVALAAILMLIYIAFRFQISSGLAAVVCLLHDLFVMLTVYSLLQLPFNINIIAAFLTILGYSINATIVVFDRIRENRKKMSEKDFGDVVDVSVHETMGRSRNTTITTLLTIGAIFVAGVITVIVSPTSNLDTLRNFAGALIAGILAGLFSSVCLSGLLWNLFSKLGKKKDSKN